MSSIGTFYKICYDREIGKGLSGSVYVATKKFDETESAVKIIKRASLSNDSIQSIANEIGALKILNHPNIVKLYDVFEDRRCFYIVMELIRGGELFDRITRKIYYLEKDARELCKIILSAIKHCHDNDIVHRDLKPENLMMASETNDTDVRIVDFGFAVRDNGSNLNGVMGSPLYMAPEIWRGETYGKGVDMWAFGVIAYILLCGYAPFNHENQDKLARLIKSGKYEFHSDHWKNVSEEAKEFVSHILQVDVSTRLTVDQALHHKWVIKYYKLLVLHKFNPQNI
jgi:serine/threonine protein kinase